MPFVNVWKHPRKQQYHQSKQSYLHAIRLEARKKRMKTIIRTNKKKIMSLLKVVYKDFDDFMTMVEENKKVFIDLCAATDYSQNLIHTVADDLGPLHSYMKNHISEIDIDRIFGIFNALEREKMKTYSRITFRTTHYCHNHPFSSLSFKVKSAGFIDEIDVVNRLSGEEPFQNEYIHDFNALYGSSIYGRTDLYKDAIFDLRPWHDLLAINPNNEFSRKAIVRTYDRVFTGETNINHNISVSDTDAINSDMFIYPRDSTITPKSPRRQLWE